MRKAEVVQNKHEHRTAEFTLLLEKIQRLRIARTVETDITAQLKLELQIEQAEKELKKLEAEILELERESPSGSAPLSPKKELQVSNLPNRALSIVGRDEEVKRALAKLKEWRQLVIQGVGGVGKSAFAELLALQALQGKWVDGAVWIDCKYQKIDIDHIISIFATTFNYKKLHSSDPTTRMQLVVKLLQATPCLFVLDNYETSVNPELTAWLLGLPDPTWLIFTLRRHKEILSEKSGLLTLKGLSETASLELIAQESKRLEKPELLDYAGEVLHETYALVDGLPLALKWICSQIGLQGRSLESVVADLRSTRGNFYDPLFYSAYDSLKTDMAQRILQVLSIFVTPINLDIFKFIFSDISTQTSLENSFTELIQCNLVEVTGGIKTKDRKYGLHPITQSYASAILKRNREFSANIQAKITEFLKKLLDEFGGDENWTGYKALDLWHENILYFIHQYDQQELWHLVIEFVQKYHYYLWARGYWHQREDVGLLALKASRELCDLPTEIWLKSRILFDVNLLLGNFPGAQKYLEESIQGALAIEDQGRLAWAFYQNGRLLRRLKNPDLAKVYAADSVKIYQQIRDEHNLGYALNGLANVENDLKEFVLAEAHYRQSLDIFDQTDDGMMQAVVTRNLAKLYRNQRDYVKSIASYQSAISIFETLDLELEIAESKSGLAETFFETCEYARATELIHSSIAIFKKLGALHESNLASSILRKIDDQQNF